MEISTTIFYDEFDCNNLSRLLRIVSHLSQITMNKEYEAIYGLYEIIGNASLPSSFLAVFNKNFLWQKPFRALLVSCCEPKFFPKMLKIYWCSNCQKMAISQTRSDYSCSHHPTAVLSSSRRIALGKVTWSGKNFGTIRSPFFFDCSEINVVLCSDELSETDRKRGNKKFKNKLPWWIKNIAVKY